MTAILQLLALSPVLWWFGKRLNDGSDEPLGLLTLGLALVLGWRERKSLQAPPQARSLYSFPRRLEESAGPTGPFIPARHAVPGFCHGHGIPSR
jgi:hypothetical protein